MPTNGGNQGRGGKQTKTNKQTRAVKQWDLFKLSLLGSEPHRPVDLLPVGA